MFMAFTDFHESASDNTSIGGKFIGEGSFARDMNDAFRQLMADFAVLNRLNAARYGFLPSNNAAANLSALEDAIADAAGGSHPTVIDLPPGDYEVDDLGITDPNIAIDGHGSTLIGMGLTSAPAAYGLRLKNLRFYHDTSAAVLTLNGDDSIYTNLEIEKSGAGDGYMAMTEQTEGCVFTNWTFRGGNGFFIETQRSLFNGIHGIGRTAGGDDFLVLKARNIRTGDIYFTACYGENYSNVLAIGGEVGTLGGGVSSTRPGRVENVRFDLMGRNCTYGVFMKPGAIDNPAAPASYDWEDGLLQDIKGRIKLADAAGSKMGKGLVFSPARNALIDDFDIEIQGEGRFANTADEECWAHIYFPDSTTYTAGGTGPGGIVGTGRIKVVGKDRYAGVDNAGPTPGYPALNGVLVSKQASGVGSITGKVRIDAEIDGTKHGGIVVSAGFDNTITIDRFIGRNLANNPGVATGGIHADSIVRAPGENEIHMANTSSKPIYISGTGDVIGRRETIDIAAAAGTDFTSFRQLPHDTWLRKMSGVAKDAVSASGTIYLSLELRAVNGTRYDGTALGGNAITTFDTQATAITQFVPFNFPAMSLAGGTYDDRFLESNAVVRIIKTNTGGGQAFVGSVDLHYVQIGPRL